MLGQIWPMRSTLVLRLKEPSRVEPALPAIFTRVTLSDAMMRHLDVDPRTLFLAPSRMSGADPVKLPEQFRRFGSSTEGMPPIEVNRDVAGEMVIYDGVTRATR